MHFWTSWNAKDQDPKGHPSKSRYVLMTDPLMQPGLKEEKADKISSMQWQLRAQTPNLGPFCVCILAAHLRACVTLSKLYNVFKL